MKEKLLEYLEELREKEELAEVVREWMFGAIMAAFVMGVVTRDERMELINKYCK